jgi:hypothetical protein
MTLRTFLESSPPSVAIAQTVEQVVRLRTNGGIRDLRVDVRDGAVVLSGQARSYYDKQLATHAAQGVVEREHAAGVEKVSLTNDIQVR